MLFTYTTNVPQGAQAISSTQAPIQSNFQAINELIDINHETFGSADFGKHKYLQMPVQASAPSFSVGEEGLYNLNYAALTAKNELYVHKQTSSGTADIPFTASILSNSTPAGGTNGWTYLPSGILMKWGTKAVTTSGAQDFNLPAGTTFGPAFSAIFSITLTSSDTSVFYALNSLSGKTVSFNFTASADTASVYFIAIGR